MSELLTRVLHEASQLPAADQDALAERWLEELHDEAAWDRSFANSQDQLAKMAEAALAEHAAGLTQLLDPDKL